MKAVIMAGGFGTRLRPLTEGVPKPCVPIVGVPCIVRMVRRLAEIGIREFHISLFYLPERIREALDLPEFRDLSIFFHEEAIPLGTAGSVKNCLDGAAEHFIVVSGDGVIDFDLAPALSAHFSHGGPLTIVSARVDDPGEYGVMLSDQSGRITRFFEKPDPAHAYSDDVNTGIYICSPSFYDCIPEGKADFSKDVFPKMLEKGIPIYRYAATGYWCDVGSVSSYLECNQTLLRLEGDSVLSPVDERTVIETPCYIGKNVKLNQCHIGPYTVIDDDCVLDGVRIEGSVLHSGVRCEPGVQVRNGVLCKNVYLHRDVRVGDDCVIGADCEIGAKTTVCAGVKLFPSNHIRDHSHISCNVHHVFRNLLAEDGRMLFPFGMDFGGAMLYEIGRAMGELFGGDIVVGRGEQKDASATMTFCGGVLGNEKNVYDTGVNDLSRFRFTVRNYAFRGGAFFQRNYSNLILRLFDGNGMPLTTDFSRKLLKSLSCETPCGAQTGMYRIFRGGTKSYLSYLKSFGIPSRLMVRVVSSPVLSSVLPKTVTGAFERMRVGDEWLRIEQADGEPFDEDLIRLCSCIAFGMERSQVWIPYSYPFVTESVAQQFGFRVIRVSEQSPDYQKCFPLTDPNVQALLILKFLDRIKRSFSEFVRDLPGFVVKQRDVPVSVASSAIMRSLASFGGELTDGIRFTDRGASVRIFPKQNANAFRIVTEAASLEQAEELCEFYSLKLKGLKPD